MRFLLALLIVCTISGLALAPDIVDTLHVYGLHSMYMYASAYAPLDPNAVEGVCYVGNPAVTSTGSYPSVGTIAVNPRVIPYNTIMYIEGYGLGIASDTGSAMRARQDLIDVCFDTRKEAIAWGIKKVKVTILKWGSKID